MGKVIVGNLSTIKSLISKYGKEATIKEVIEKEALLKEELETDYLVGNL